MIKIILKVLFRTILHLGILVGTVVVFTAIGWIYVHTLAEQRLGIIAALVVAAVLLVNVVEVLKGG